jgi:hypothetical protein
LKYPMNGLRAKSFFSPLFLRCFRSNKPWSFSLILRLVSQRKPLHSDAYIIVILHIQFSPYPVREREYIATESWQQGSSDDRHPKKKLLISTRTDCKTPKFSPYMNSNSVFKPSILVRRHFYTPCIT